MPNRDGRYSKRGAFVPFTFKKCKCGNDINPPRGPGRPYTVCVKCMKGAKAGYGRRRKVYMRRLREARALGDGP